MRKSITESTSGPRTAYLFPGQGIQQLGMLRAERAASTAVAQVWQAADAFTSAELGFSVLRVVDENPQTLTVGTQRFAHPAGVLNLTQFTQVALLIAACAQIAQLREAELLATDAFIAGHSLGEFSALTALGGVFTLAQGISVVYRRGEIMQELVRRDEDGKSQFAMVVLRPDQIGLADDDVEGYLADLSAVSGEFIELANVNVRGQQYAVVATTAGLAALQADAKARAERVGGRMPTIAVPGVDVPFHSSWLRPGVDEFRSHLKKVLGDAAVPTSLIGRFVPNLTGRPFTLDDDLITLLSEQFARPVRWAEIQETLLSAGVNQVVEVGLAHAPVLTNMFKRTLTLADRVKDVQVINLQRDYEKLPRSATSS